VVTQLPSNRRRRVTSEVGTTGTPVFGGIVREEDYNLDWRGSARYTIPDKMAKSDGTVAAALRMIKMPLLQGEFTVESPDDTPLRKQQAKFCESQILNTSFSWQYYMNHVLRMLNYGSFPFEKVREVTLLPDGNTGIGIRKLAPRHPKTVLEWHVDRHGGPVGILQQTMDDRLDWQDVFLPIRDLLIFVNDQEGSDLKGQSILRPAYKHWWIKQGMESVDAVAKEKRGMGIDVVELTDEADTDDQEKFESALQTIRTHERNYMVYRSTKGTYRIEGIGESATLDTIETIELHDLRILRALLTEGLTNENNSQYRVGRDRSEITMMSIAAIGDNILDTHNRHVIRQLIDWNWGPLEPDEYPKMRHTKLDTRDVARLAQAISQLSGAGFIAPTPEIQEELLELLELPPATGAVAQIPPVRERQIATMTNLARKYFETKDLDALVKMSVPYKSEAADFYRRGNSPLDRVAAQSKANHEADMLKEVLVGVVVDFLAHDEFDESALRQVLMEAH
jgi:hypothetical protein